MARKAADIQIKIRGPAGLHKMIAVQAAKNGRSISQEYVHRLQRSFETEITAITIEVAAQKAAMDAIDMAFERLGMAKVFTPKKEGENEAEA